jgi:hypothetical protein
MEEGVGNSAHQSPRGEREKEDAPQKRWLYGAFFIDNTTTNAEESSGKEVHIVQK